MSHLAKVTRTIAKRASKSTKTTTNSALGLSLYEDPLTAKFSTAPPQVTFKKIMRKFFILIFINCDK